MAFFLPREVVLNRITFFLFSSYPFCFLNTPNFPPSENIVHELGGALARKFFSPVGPDSVLFPTPNVISSRPLVVLPSPPVATPFSTFLRAAFLIGGRVCHVPLLHPLLRPSRPLAICKRSCPFTSRSNKKIEPGPCCYPSFGSWHSPLFPSFLDALALGGMFLCDPVLRFACGTLRLHFFLG